MVAWSTFIRLGTQGFCKIPGSRPKLLLKNVSAIPSSQTCNMSSDMVITASKWQWHKTKNLVHFYFMAMAIPLGIVTFCANVFVGPATLTEIPEDYVPQYWEYYRSPITRFLARYLFFNPQKDYEKTLHTIYIESQVMEIRKLEKKIMNLQEERQDFKYRVFPSFDSESTRVRRETAKRILDDAE